VRKPGLSWPLSAALELAGIVVRDMLMGSPPTSKMPRTKIHVKLGAN